MPKKQSARGILDFENQEGEEIIEYEIADAAKAAWEGRFKDEASSTFFHQAQWCDVLRETYDLHSKIITVHEKGTSPVCSLTVCVADGLLGTRLVSLPFSDYGGPITTREGNLYEIGEVLSNALDSLALETHARYVLFKSTPPDLAALMEPRSFTRLGRIGTFAVKLDRPIQEIEKQFDKDIQRRIRKGIQDGLRMTDEHDIESVNGFYELYLRDMRRHGSPPHDRKYFENIFRTFEASGLIKLFGCRFQGRMLGYVLHLLYKDTALFYVGVWPGKARQMGVAPFLIGNSIRFFSEEGYRVYDFGRTICPSGESRFKESFGATYRSQNSLVKIYAGKNYL